MELSSPIPIKNDKKIDRHGCVDFRVEGWENIWFNRSKDSAEIQGASVNCFMHAAFLLLGHKKEFLALPGGLSCWDALLESFFVTLSQQMTVYEIMARVELVAVEILTMERIGFSEMENMSYEYNVNLLFGGLSFVYIWIANFNSYITDHQLTALRGLIVDLGNIGLRNIDVTNIPVEMQESSSLCRKQYCRLEVLIDVVTAERSRVTLGFRQAVSFTPYHFPHMQLLTYVESKYDEAVQHFLSLKHPSYFQYRYHTRNFNLNTHFMPFPAVQVLKGEWDDSDTVKRRENAKALAKAPKYKLEIFGGDNIFDDFDESDDEKSLQSASPDEITEDSLPSKPQPRVPIGVSLLNGPLESVSGALKSPMSTRSNSIFFNTNDDNTSNEDDMERFSFRLNTPLAASKAHLSSDPSFWPSLREWTGKCKSIWDFETLEIARQMTLIDHALFCDIPLHSLLFPRWSEPRHCRSSPELRKFIDRFNAISLWSTTSVLRENSVQVRADRYMSLVELASHLLDLGNYSSAMAIVTALQQSCITRLKRTLKLIGPKEKEKFSSMQKRLSPSKNYVVYKQEIEGRALYLHDDSDWRHRFDGIDARLRRILFAKKIADDKKLLEESGKMDNNKVELFGASAASSSTTASQRVETEAFVPHIGAHLGELTGIYEGNPDYLPEAPHMLNFPKKVFISRCVCSLARMQRLVYNIQAIRMIAAIINRNFRPYLRFSSQENKSTATKLYSRSQLIEPDDYEDYDEMDEEGGSEVVDDSTTITGHHNNNNNNNNNSNNSRSVANGGHGGLIAGAATISTATTRDSEVFQSHGNVHSLDAKPLKIVTAKAISTTTKKNDHDNGSEDEEEEEEEDDNENDEGDEDEEDDEEDHPGKKKGLASKIKSLMAFGAFRRK